jgi:hypothetical protein
MAARGIKSLERPGKDLKVTLTVENQNDGKRKNDKNDTEYFSIRINKKLKVLIYYVRGTGHRA